jgi:hypothetical protein
MTIASRSGGFLFRLGVEHTEQVCTSWFVIVQNDIETEQR